MLRHKSLHRSTKFLAKEMDEFFEEIQGESKAQATEDNARRGTAFLAWLKTSYPACWDAEETFSSAA